MHQHKKIAFRILSFFICLILMVQTFAISGSGVTYHTASNYSSSVYFNRLSDTSLTGNPRVDIVNVALSQYGYAESDEWWDLTGMDKGISNLTEYGNWYGLQGMWCAMFVSWCASHAGISNNVVPSHSYTPSGVLWFMDRNCVMKREDVESGKYIPQSGDIIYYRSDRNDSIVNHVGIVLGYFDGYVYTVEGNINFDPNCTDGGQVLLRSRHISDPIIRYFCTPNYSSDVNHEINDFFPADYSPPAVADAELSLGEQPENTIDTPHATSPSSGPQYTFIP